MRYTPLVVAALVAAVSAVVSARRGSLSGTLLLTFACLLLIARVYKDWRKDDQ
jgi:hypothetical protein